MACKNICRLCNKLILSSAVNFDSTSNELIIAIPEGTYYNNEKYCIVVAQAIPTSATINATVVITIGNGATRYPLVRCNCQPATACNIRTRTKYSVVVATNTTSGLFRLLGDIGCIGAEVLPSLPITTTTLTQNAVVFSSEETAPTKVSKTTKAKEVIPND